MMPPWPEPCIWQQYTIPVLHSDPYGLCASSFTSLLMACVVVLCTQVKVQTVPGYAKGLTDGLPKFVANEGIGG